MEFVVPLLSWRHYFSTTQTYLTDEEFQKVFSMTVGEFNKLPQWKRKDLKKKVDLF